MRNNLSKTIVFKKIFFIAVSIFAFTGCNYYKNTGNQDLQIDQNADVTTLAIYNNYTSINNTILSKQCSSCHSASSGNKGGLNLESYTNVKANLNQIMYRVLETKDMPPNGLTNSQFNLLKFWLESGAPEHNTTNGPGSIIQGPLNWTKIKNQILAKNCLDCHQGDKPDAGLDLGNLENFKNNYAKIFDRIFVKQDMPIEPYSALTTYEQQALLKWMSQGFQK